MIHHISDLPKDSHFLLGFSGGVDSSALFFLLLESNVSFDVAIVDYAVREESRLEVDYAQKLAMQYGKKIHILQAPKIKSNFEASARKIRYEFFGQLIETYQYKGVILAHQLNDRLEWFLMQFSRGAGLNTMLGFGFCERVYGFDVFRPLLEVSKEELYRFCQNKKIQYFEDLSNQDEEFLRNRFRKLSAFLMQNSGGIRSSFAYLEKEKQMLYPKAGIDHLGELRAFEREGENKDLHTLDLECKKLGYVLSSKQRQEIKRCGFSCEIAHLMIECNERRIFIAPKVQCFKMDKSYRDWARRLKIPKRLRGLVHTIWAEGNRELEIKRFFA